MNWFEWRVIVFIYFPIFVFIFSNIVSYNLVVDVKDKIKQSGYKYVSKKKSFMYNLNQWLLFIFLCITPIINFFVLLSMFLIVLNMDEAIAKSVNKKKRYGLLEKVESEEKNEL